MCVHICVRSTIYIYIYMYVHAVRRTLRNNPTGNHLAAIVTPAVRMRTPHKPRSCIPGSALPDKLGSCVPGSTRLRSAVLLQSLCARITPLLPPFTIAGGIWHTGGQPRKLLSALTHHPAGWRRPERRRGSCRGRVHPYTRYLLRAGHKLATLAT